MNILITCLSPYNNKDNTYTYNTNGLCSSDVIEAKHTNEPVLKLLHSILKDKNEKIDKIIPILSYEVENKPGKADDTITSYHFFSDLVKEVLNESNTEKILDPVRDYKDESTLRETGAVIDDICKRITSDDNIYIDTSGGKRTSADMLQLLTKILEYKGYKLAGSYYSNINVAPHTIQTTDNFTQLTALADAVNEFVHTGRSYQLAECFTDENNAEINALISCMKQFTDKMQLCNISDLDTLLDEMRSHLEKVSSIRSDDAKIVILRNLLPVIENKFFDGPSNTIDYCRMIKWCLENNLIQQAITIYIEKIPKYIFDSRILICDEKYISEVREKQAKKPQNKNIYAFIFYDEFMDYVSSTEKNNIAKLRTALTEKFKKHNQSYKYDPDLKKYMDAFYKIKKSSRSAGTDFKSHMEEICTCSDTCISRIERTIADLSLQNQYTEFDTMISGFCNNETGLGKIMGISKENSSTFDKKIRTASNITENDCVSQNITINPKTDINVLRSILFDYIYVKAIRNQINHASDEENLTENQKNEFESRQYNVRDFSAEAIGETLKASIERIEKAAENIK